MQISEKSAKSKNAIYSIPGPIRTKLSELRQLISRFVVSQAFILFAIWFVAAFWVFGILDYLPMQLGAAESPRVVRSIMLGTLALVSIALLYRFFWKLWLIRWSDSSLALLIENKYPEFRSSLVTTVQAASPSKVAQSDDHPRRSSLLEMARAQAVEHIDAVEVSRIVRFRPLQLQLIVLGLLLAASIVFALFQPAWTYHWSRRFFALSNEPWPRLAVLGVEGVELDVPTFTGKNARQRYTLPFDDGMVAVPKGQSCQLKSWAELNAKLVPEVCTVYYRDEEGNRGRANMRRLPPSKRTQPFVLDGPPLESVNDSIWLSLAGADAKISNLLIQSVDAPLVTEIVLEVTYPEYLQRSTKTTWGSEKLAYRTGARLPLGTQVKLVVQTNKPITRCEYVMVRSGETKDRTEQPEESLHLNESAAHFELPTGTLQGNLLVEMRLWDTQGICSSRVQQFVVTAISDQTPQVDLVLQGIGTAITENAVLPVNSRIKDDYDVKQAWIETVVDENSPMKSLLQLMQDGKASQELDLKALREEGKLIAKVGSTLGLTVAAEDYLDLTADPHVGRANPIQLGVVTPDQLLIVMDRRELAMRARLEQIIGELTQMRDLMLNIQKAGRVESVEAGSQSSKEGEETEPKSPDDPSKRLRLQVLRSQQASAQLVKSEGELRGVEKEIGQINQELINNRIDSADRRTRLEDKIRMPLQRVLDIQWGPLESDMLAIEKSFSRTAQPDPALDGLLPNSVSKNNQVIVALTAILNDMIDIQDFNEVVDMVRGMIDDQNKVLEKTKQEQKKQLLDSLK